MSVNDSFSIKIKKKSGKWGWSLNCIGFVLTGDYFEIKNIVNCIKYKHPVVVIFNNSQNHVSEIHLGDFNEILHNEVKQ